VDFPGQEFVKPGIGKSQGSSRQCRRCGITLSPSNVFRPFAASAMSYKGVRESPESGYPDNVCLILPPAQAVLSVSSRLVGAGDDVLV
jgi:hypothetical protein